MSTKPDDLRDLRDTLSHLSTTQDKARAAITYLRSLDSQPISESTSTHNSVGGNTNFPVPPTPVSMDEFVNLTSQNNVMLEMLAMAASTNSSTTYVLKSVPCAYVDMHAKEECRMDGTAACSRCRLVKYCSKAWTCPLFWKCVELISR